MTALSALAAAAFSPPAEGAVPAGLDAILRQACAGAWRAVEVVLAGDVLRNRLSKTRDAILRDAVEGVLGLFGSPALRAEELAGLRAARDAGAFDGAIDTPSIVAAVRAEGAVVAGRNAIAGVRRAIAAYRDLDRALADAELGTLLIDAVRAVFRGLARAPELAGWAIGPTGSPHRDRALAAFAELAASQPSLDELETLIALPIALDDNVQFTVYRPRAIDPGKWHQLLAFAHLAERRPGEDDLPDPVEEVQRQAAQVLGEQARSYQPVTQDAGAAIPAEGELTFVPELPGIEVNPPRRSFLWLEPVHREEFRIRAPRTLDSKTIRGRVTVFLGSIAIAEVAVSVKIDAARPEPTKREPAEARTYRRIFASYSHKDIAIVNQFESYARALGDEYLRDWVHLRTGEVWNDRLRQLIEQADAFQLFWSWNSMNSKFVRAEYEHALALDRPSFVRPTYWEDPMPTAPGLPPDALLRLHFQKLGGLARETADQLAQAEEARARRKRAVAPAPDLEAEIERERAQVDALPDTTARTSISPATPGLTDEIEAVLTDAFGDIGDSTTVTNRAPSVVEEEPAKPKQDAAPMPAPSPVPKAPGPAKGRPGGTMPPPMAIPNIPVRVPPRAPARESERRLEARKDSPPKPIDPRVLASALPEKQRAVASAPAPESTTPMPAQPKFDESPDSTMPMGLSGRSAESLLDEETSPSVSPAPSAPEPVPAAAPVRPSQQPAPPAANRPSALPAMPPGARPSPLPSPLAPRAMAPAELPPKLSETEPSPWARPPAAPAPSASRPRPELPSLAEVVRPPAPKRPEPAASGRPTTNPSAVAPMPARPSAARVQPSKAELDTPAWDAPTAPADLSPDVESPVGWDNTTEPAPIAELARAARPIAPTPTAPMALPLRPPSQAAIQLPQDDEPASWPDSNSYTEPAAIDEPPFAPASPSWSDAGKQVIESKEIAAPSDAAISWPNEPATPPPPISWSDEIMEKEAPAAALARKSGDLAKRAEPSPPKIPATIPGPPPAPRPSASSQPPSALAGTNAVSPYAPTVPQPTYSQGPYDPRPSKAKLGPPVLPNAPESRSGRWLLVVLILILLAVAAALFVIFVVNG